MPDPKTATADLAEIAAALDAGEIVPVRDLKIHLRTPLAPAIKEIRKLMIGARADDLDNLEVGFEIAFSAVKACRPDMDDETVTRLIAYSGGERSELSAAALTLCGVPISTADLEDLPEDLQRELAGGPVAAPGPDASGDADGDPDLEGLADRPT